MKFIPNNLPLPVTSGTAYECRLLMGADLSNFGPTDSSLITQFPDDPFSAIFWNYVWNQNCYGDTDGFNTAIGPFFNYASFDRFIIWSPAGWAQASVVYPGQLILNGNNLYVCQVGGVTSATSSGPSGTNSGIIDGPDSSVIWNYTGSVWAQNIVYNQGDLVITENPGAFYVCTQTGTSSNVNGPQSENYNEDIIDGTVHWKYIGVPTPENSSNAIMGTNPGPIGTITSPGIFYTPGLNQNWWVGKDMLFNGSINGATGTMSVFWSAFLNFPSSIFATGVAKINGNPEILYNSHMTFENGTGALAGVVGFALANNSAFVTTWGNHGSGASAIFIFPQ